VAKGGRKDLRGTICGRISFWQQGATTIRAAPAETPFASAFIGCRVTGVERDQDVAKPAFGLFDRSHDKRQVIRESLLGCGPVAERDQFGPDLDAVDLGALTQQLARCESQVPLPQPMSKTCRRRSVGKGASSEGGRESR